MENIDLKRIVDRLLNMKPDPIPEFVLLWEFPKKFDFAISNSWRGKNKIIDSTIFVLRFLCKKKAF